jgi:hypothetical protein
MLLTEPAVVRGRQVHLGLLSFTSRRLRVDAYVLDALNMVLRWAHIITGIAWIGASFYFVSLDNSLTPPKDKNDADKGVGGEQWGVHGGGFYHHQKYPVSPGYVPDQLHWSMWESYSTWLTGFALFTVLYLFNASTFLIDKSLFDWSPAAAITTALAFFVAFWVLYDGICRTLGRGKNGDMIVGGVVFGLIVVALVGCLPPVRGPCRLPAGGRHDRHDHERQCLLLDHSRAAQGGGCHPGGPAGGPGARPARQAAQRAQHLLHPARVVLDDEQPLRLHLHRAEQLAGAGGHHDGRRIDPAVVCAAPQGPRPWQARALALRRDRHRAAAGHALGDSARPQPATPAAAADRHRPDLPTCRA